MDVVLYTFIGLMLVVAVICFIYLFANFINNKDIFFSVSHSGEKVIVMFSDKEIGCDIEKIGKPNFEISKRFFSENENSLLKNIKSEEEKTRMFYRLWTLKESYLLKIKDAYPKMIITNTFDGAYDYDFQYPHLYFFDF